MSKITNDGWQRMLYSCTHMATVGVKGLSTEVTWLLWLLLSPVIATFVLGVWSYFTICLLWINVIAWCRWL